MRKKLCPLQRHTVVKNYVAFLEWKSSSFESINHLCDEFKISRNVPSKTLKQFQKLRTELRWNTDFDYKTNIFIERSHLRLHRSLPEDENYEQYLSKYPRWWHQSYCASMSQKWATNKMKKWMYYYYKESCKAKTHSVAPPKKESKPKMTAKEWYEELYKLYDFVIHLDGKSLEDQHRVQQNHQLKNQYKRISMAVEAKGWLICGIRAEKSHNKTNALIIIKEICDHIQLSYPWKKICFITDAWSEYLWDKKLRWIEITSLETSQIATFLKSQWHWRRITRRPEDNSFIENKNDYIERICLDNEDIKKMNKSEFIAHLDSFIQLNNSHLVWCKKSFRGTITPCKHMIQRFWNYAIESRMKWIHAIDIAWVYKLPSYKTTSLCIYLDMIRIGLRERLFSPFHGEKSMHPKSVDSSIWQKTIAI